MEKPYIPDGVHDQPSELYHASSAISRSALMYFKKSPYHYDKRYNDLTWVDSPPTPALIMGDIVHTMVLEPEKSEERYVIKPSFDRRTKAGKIDYERFLCGVQGRKVIDSEMLNQALKIGLAVRDNHLAQAIIADSKIEQSIYFTHEPTGIQCKVRPDIWNNTLIGDLKTTNDASYYAFQRSAFNYGYFLQAGMIHQALRSIGIKMEKFIFIVVEKDEPNALGIYEIDDEALDYGIEQFDSLMSLLYECRLKNSFPAYPFQPLSIPNYAHYQQNSEVQHDD